MAEPSSRKIGFQRKRIRHATRREIGEKTEDAATTFQKIDSE